MKKKVLKKRIEELEKLVDQQQTLINQLQFQQNNNWVYVNPDPCLNGGYHEYPDYWYGTTPPPCNKCGKVQYGYNTYTISNGTYDNSVTNFNSEDITYTGNAGIA